MALEASVRTLGGYEERLTTIDAGTFVLKFCSLPERVSLPTGAVGAGPVQLRGVGLPWR